MKQPFEVGPEGGTVGPSDGSTQLAIEPGVLNHATTVTIFSVPTNEDIPALSDQPIKDAIAVGPIVEIKVSSQPSAATVRMAFEVEYDLPTSGGRSATIANAFIASYNEAVGAWVPLATTYDAATRQLVAAAPHFSWFRKFVIDPATAIWNGAKSGLELFADKIVAAIVDSFDPPQDVIDCPPGSTWRVKTDQAGVRACVAEGPVTQLRIENDTRVPFVVHAPPTFGFDREPPDDPDTITLVARALASLTDDGSLAGRGRTAVNHPLLLDSSYRVELNPDKFAFALRAVFGLASWIPSTHTVETVLAQSTVRTEITVIAGNSLTTATFFREVTLVVQREMKGLPQEIASVGTLFDTLDCVIGGLEADDEPKSSAGAILELAVDMAKDCFVRGVDKLGEDLEQGVGDVLNLIAALPQSIGAVLELGDWIALGFENFAGIVHIDVLPPRTAVELTTQEWEPILRADMSCMAFPPEWAKYDHLAPRLLLHDIIPDGRAEVFAIAACPSPTAGNPVQVSVYDGASPADAPHLLGVLGSYSTTGGKDYLKTVEVEFDGLMVRVFGEAVSESGARCCPDTFLTLGYRWAGSAFEETSRAARPL